jgi:23S rRNA (adenine2030-N6)-methyltransferase
MNYRHHFHAGNFADVWKHTLLLPLIRGLQRKEKGFLILDTHAGRGAYDLTSADYGDSLERKPEYPNGIAKIWNAENLPSPVREYVEMVKTFDRSRGNLEDAPRFFPGSPWLAQLCARPQDRVALCELHEAEHESLKDEFWPERRVSVHLMDGYTAVRAMLPPLEKRALVLIDPPFEEKAEFTRILTALRDGLQRLPAGTFAVWYPLTERARVDEFLDNLMMNNPPPCFIAELMVVGEQSAVKMKGCGLLVLNPPWQVDKEVSVVCECLGRLLAQEPGASARMKWLVPEK